MLIILNILDFMILSQPSTANYVLSLWHKIFFMSTGCVEFPFKDRVASVGHSYLRLSIFLQQ